MSNTNEKVEKQKFIDGDPISSTILREIVPAVPYSFTKTRQAYQAMDRRHQLAQLVDVYNGLIGEGAGNLILPLGEDVRDLAARLDANDSTAIVEVSFFAQQMWAVNTPFPYELKEFAKKDFKGMAIALEGKLSEHYTPKPLDLLAQQKIALMGLYL